MAGIGGRRILPTARETTEGLRATAGQRRPVALAAARRGVSVIVPTYREARNLPELVRRLGDTAAAAGLDLELIIVDDDSGDSTPEVIGSLDRAWVTLITRRAERGLSSAVLAGLGRATGDILVVMDADLSHAPEDVARLVEEVRAGAEMAIGSRYKRGCRTGMTGGWLRGLNSLAATALARPLTGVADPMSGFFAIRREVFERAEGLNPVGYKVGLEVLVKSRARRVVEVPIRFAPRLHGRSKLTLGQQALYLEHLRRLYAWRFGREPAALLAGALPGAFAALGVLTVLVQLWYVSFRELVPDEAYYWVWSHHPALSYFDHPPMVAWLIRLSTALLGATELGVRFFAVVLGVASTFVMARVAVRVSGDRRIGALTGILLLVSPALSAMDTVMTPDTPAWFFGACALLAAVEGAGGEPRAGWCGAGRWWLMLGLCLGLAMLSKYTGVLLGAAVGLALLSCRRGRSHLRTPWPWAGAVIAVLLFTPVLVWNAEHQWASFRFQLHHGFRPAPGNAVLGMGAYIGGQAVAWTPVLAVVSVSLLWKESACFRRLALERRIVLLAALVPLLLFLYSSAGRKAEMNWPVMAYGPLAVITAAGVGGAGAGWRRGWFGAGCVVAAAITLVGHTPELLWRLGLPHSSLERMFGWRQMAVELVEESRGDPIVCNRYQDAAEMAFYMPGHPDLWAVNLGGSRPNEYDYLGSRCPLPPGRCILVDWPPGEPEKHFAATITHDWVCTLDGRRIMHRRITRVADPAGEVHAPASR